ncbi:MAG: alpha/beta fold hydrolase [Cohaesibacter sp.]|nr:alpha/beta fold hydrolase [Cohaesibacter sp.]
MAVSKVGDAWSGMAAHMNTILGNNGPRKWWVSCQIRDVERLSHEIILPCEDGVQLHGVYSPNPNDQGRLAILIHGWEGCFSSTYLMSATKHLYENGYSVFRLHLRDHGPTHHLNEEPFLAVRLDEVVQALGSLHKRVPDKRFFLAGFSMGGNFVVRIAARAKSHGYDLPLVKALALCPPVDPEQVSYSIANSQIYNRYFVRKWHKSLSRKMMLYPSFQPHADLLNHRDLVSLQEDFIPRFSEYETASSYFADYGLTKTTLSSMDVPCHLLFTRDDPVIPVADCALLPKLEGLSYEIAPSGGHCGFVKAPGLSSWADDYILRYFEQDELLF